MNIERSGAAGFSIIEMMVCIALFLVISGAVMSSMLKMQQSRKTNEIRAGLEDKVRAASELIMHDIGQAGKTPVSDTALYTTASFSSTNSTASYTNPTTAQGGSTACGSASGSFPLATVTISGLVPNLYPGESVLIDSGAANQEQGWICGNITSASTSSLSIMRSAGGTNYSHSAATALYPMGVFAEGILSQNRTGIASSVGSLYLMGDIDETGALVLVRYKCSNTSTTGTGGGTLTRTVWNFTDAINSTGTTATLLDNVACRFDYSDDAGSPYINLLQAGPSDHLNNYYVVSAVNMYIAASSDTNDPVTGTPWLVSKSYENIQPRNLINAIQADKVYRQWTPTTGIFASTSLP